MSESAKDSELYFEYRASATGTYHGSYAVVPKGKTLRPMVQLMMGRPDWLDFISHTIRSYPDIWVVKFRCHNALQEVTDYTLSRDVLEAVRTKGINLDPFILG